MRGVTEDEDIWRTASRPKYDSQSLAAYREMTTYNSVVGWPWLDSRCSGSCSSAGQAGKKI